jgi:hypothetical protein
LVVLRAGMRSGSQGGRQSREDLGLFLHVDLTDKLEDTDHHHRQGPSHRVDL